MKQSTAISHLRRMLFLLQKFRSNSIEALLGSHLDVSKDERRIVKETLVFIHPWLFDDSKCPILALVDILDRVDRANILVPINYMNMMTILYRFLPELLVVSALFPRGGSLPSTQPPYQTYLMGWEPENTISS